MNIITGEKIQFLCDIYICKQGEDIKPFNPNVYRSKCISIQNLSHENLIDKEYIFIYPHIIKNNYNKLYSILCKKENKFIIVTHNSDQNIENIFDEILKETKCIKVFCQNLNIDSNNIYNYLPIGIANSQWSHGNENLIKDIINLNNNKEDKIFFNFSINTNYDKRKKCYNELKNKIQFLKKMDQRSYLQELSKSKFCICPEGNGLDTHRLWECFYLRTIPICKDSIFIRNIKKDFPVLIVDEWDELVINDELYSMYDKYIKDLNITKLDFGYWKNKIITFF
jgi:hypothetical protein